MSFLDTLRNSAVTDLIKDQRLKDLVVRREFRISEEYLKREFLHRVEGDEVRNVTLGFRRGYAELGAEVKKSFLPFPIPVSARLSVADVRFTPKIKMVSLRLEEVRPLDSDWLKRRLVEKIPFMRYETDGIISCDLGGVPQLADLLEYRVKGIKVSDFITVKEVNIREGELVGRVGLVL